jgi:hypothetical protein
MKRMDDCAFNKVTAGGNELTIRLHVDDTLFYCVDESTIDEVIAKLREKYVDVTVSEDQRA